MLSIKDLAKLQRPTQRYKQGLALIEGHKVIVEAMQANLEITECLYTKQFASLHNDVIQKVRKTGAQLVDIADGTALRLSETKTPSGIFAVIKIPKTDFSQVLGNKRFKTIVAFDGIKDPGNLGTMLRTADWFGVDAILLSSDGADMYNEKVVRATMGSVFHLPIFRTTQLAADLQSLKDNGCAVIAATLDGKPSDKFVTPPYYCLVMGNESVGISGAVMSKTDTKIKIPGKGQAESLNVAISFGILLYQLTI